MQPLIAELVKSLKEEFSDRNSAKQKAQIKHDYGGYKEIQGI